MHDRSHALLVSPPLFGHIIPLLELGKKLMDHGYFVTMVLSKSKVNQLYQRELIPDRFQPVLRLVGITDKNDAEYEIADYNIAYRMEPLLVSVCRALIAESTRRNDLLGLIEQGDVNVLAPNISAADGEKPNIAHVDLRITVIITDFCLTAPIQVGHSHNIPSYMFSAFSASLLRHMLVVTKDTPVCKDAVDYADRIRPIDLATNLPMMTESTKNFILRINDAVPLTSGFLVNSFREFDPEAVDNLETKLTSWNVPLKFVGPLLAVTQTDFSPATRMLVQWLDEQPLRSVIYVSFGSMVVLPDEQVIEIATALMAHGSPAIWSLREQQQNLLPPEINTKIEKLAHQPGGVIVSPWVPQRTVLGHPATGAMITHCGWNGTLESIFYGIPTLVWPIMDDQPVNAESAVQNRLSVQISPVHFTNPSAIVPAAEIQQKLTELKNEKFLMAAKHWAEVSHGAVSSGGSSYQEFHKTFVMHDLL
ncbi:uncharacterized protein LOC129581608 isoform X2 [Paramacrobiotus metropolitanus]|nr:uncharacterized protein LOC129581608 isoform X2 [Paramacrobiotus metropolitanus]XP_055328771.1 uncharacterized protein LOC129581608 isoform X2 [Paramacrobiotus metropolitanus]XP_055328772.1 uncharacterized protein LOC129581608 isoform X2 [Paramacrobiotus metropolitanus]